MMEHQWEAWPPTPPPPPPFIGGKCTEFSSRGDAAERFIAVVLISAGSLRKAVLHRLTSCCYGRIAGVPGGLTDGLLEATVESLRVCGGTCCSGELSY